ncbi:MAG: hypothetical protein FGF53_06470 [Candidatus Brockarchaeota archaeon]|nr:hypothetical protein [Candidatus Brockarchaeota archaeon]MBO3809152.1 hypothetical protein [Candidatus Brockarchaeota archaeon]
MEKQEFLRIRRMGPVSNLLLVAVSLPFLLLDQGTVFFGLVFWNLLVLSGT